MGSDVVFGVTCWKKMGGTRIIYIYSIYLERQVLTVLFFLSNRKPLKPANCLKNRALGFPGMYISLVKMRRMFQ